MDRIYFHVDLDAFFASVEQADNPSLRGKPVIIGARPGHRGVVAACSYEARAFGIHSAMPISEAYLRCPQAIYLPVAMARYRKLSGKIMSFFSDYTPKVRQISVDEASLDMTGTERLFGSPEESAHLIKDRVRAETGLTISIGIAPNRYLAKLASEYDKPDGLFRVHDGKAAEFLDKLSLRDLWGLGEKTRRRLNDDGITSVQILRDRTLEALQAKLGNAVGSYLYKIVRGIDPGIYRETRKSHSISNERTFERDTADGDEIRRTLLLLSHQVVSRMIHERIRPRTVFVKLRFADFRTTSIQRTLPNPPSSADELFSYATEMTDERWRGEPLRLLGVGVSTSIDKEGAKGRQGELFEAEDSSLLRHGKSTEVSNEKRRRLEEAVYKMKREGNRLTKASLLETDKATKPSEE